jgi:sterol desaturase/sphingolipid hydroxylase (fatty acid hydroxylase superfamily)
MSRRRIELVSGAVGSILLMVFIIGLAESISSGAAGFWGGLPFWVIIALCLVMVWYDYWDSCVRKK